MIRPLLVMGCSATKAPGEGWMPARDRYTGPLWQTLKACDCGPDVSVAVVSAHHGFIAATAMTLPYNKQLTPRIADELVAQGVHALWPKAPAGACPTSYGNRAICEMATLAQDRQFGRVILCGGRPYLTVMRWYVREFQSTGYIAAGAEITEINGPIGMMRQQLREAVQGNRPAGILTKAA
ncbi:hypothetical protein LDL36_03125 [Komagataeibacter sp. FNDCR1]|nr:hypothetical protein [Komagataeibacter sp. FNDCR1]